MALIQGKRQLLVIAMIRPMFNVSTNSRKNKKHMQKSQSVIFNLFFIVKQVRAIFRDRSPQSAWNAINITTPGKRKITEWMHE